MSKVLNSVFLIISFCCSTTAEEDPKTTEPIQVSVTIHWDQPMQTIQANGVNFEGYHTTGGTEVLSSRFENLLGAFNINLARVSMPLKIWEPENDDPDPASFNLDNFNDSEGVHFTFLRMQELKKRGIASWISLWDIADWNVVDPAQRHARQVKDIEEMAESIGTFILHSKEAYDVIPQYVSVNEPTIATENGWGGYQIAMTPADQIQLIAATGKWFEQHGISTRWLIALHKIYPSELAQAKQIYNAVEIRDYVGGFDFHGYSLQKEEMEDDLRNWGDWIQTTGLPAFCGECDYDNKFWENQDRLSWNAAALNYGTLMYKMYNLAKINGVLPWYKDAPATDRPYRYVSRHFINYFTPGTSIVKSESSSGSIMVSAGMNDQKRIIQLQNAGNQTIEVIIQNSGIGKFNWISSVENYYFSDNGSINESNNQLSVLLKPQSMNTLVSE